MSTSHAPLLGRYGRVLTLVPKLEATYRIEVFVFGLVVVTRIFLFTVLWRALYDPGQVNGGMTVEQAIGYSTLTALFSGHRDLSVDDFPQRIREGTIVYLFLRPLSPLGYYWLQSAGAIVYRTGWVLVGGAIGVLVGIVPLPSSAAVLGLSLVSFLLAECVFVALELYIQLVAFWSVEVHGVYGVWIFTQLLLSGSLVPLWFFPSLAQRVLLVLPFASSAGTPASMYVGRIGPGAIAGAMALQAGWVAVLAAGGALIWRRAERRVVVQGG